MSKGGPTEMNETRRLFLPPCVILLFFIIPPLFTRFFLLLATIDRILPADGGQAVYVSPDGGGEIEIYAPFRLNSNGGNLTFFFNLKKKPALE